MPTARFRHITPLIAMAMLERNTGNRNVSQRHINHLARQMREGKFQTNGDAVRIASNGTLLDGQHRLRALVQAGASLQMLVVEDLDAAVAPTIDGRIRVRQAGDVLAINGFKDTSTLAGAARMVWGYTTGGISAALRPDASNEEVLVVAREHPLLGESVRYVRSHTTGQQGSRKIPAFVHFIGGLIDPDERDRFFDRTLRMIGLAEGDPELALRRKIDRHVAGLRKLSPEQQFTYWTQAWNHRMAGNRVTRLQLPSDGRAVDFDPQPVFPTT